jgi:hypothetical protein
MATILSGKVVNSSVFGSEYEWLTLVVRMLETGTTFCGADARVVTTYFFEGELEMLILEIIHVIPAQEGKVMPFHETIPDFFQSNCGGVIPLFAEEIDKLAVNVEIGELVVKLEEK